MTRVRKLVPIFLAGASCSFVWVSTAQANDAMFPAQKDATASIGWKNNYFTVNGKPTVINAGEIHYARVPRGLWRERLVKMKRAGLNTISTYSFWNAHEPEPGVFEFDDNLDLDAWLTEIESVGLYAIVRPGPYNCAEWLAGGIPQWIPGKGIEIRNDNADYLAAADRYYEKIIPIIAKHQIHKGGSVIWVQVENEHPAGWGTESNAYLKHLYDKARALGLDVPLYFSGLHHSSDPAGGTPFGNRSYPWYSSEFWSGWYSLPFGEMGANDLNVLARGAWKVIAFGGGGNTFYVSHGGTNFGYSGDTATTSYDYRAPLGEEGQLRQAYFAIRRPASFSRSFEALLGNSQDGGTATVSSGLKTYVRKSESDGIAVFLDNQGTGSVQTQVKLSSPAIQFPVGNTQITVAANEIRPVVAAVPWTTNATFSYLATNVLGKLTTGTKTYYVCHGRSGEAGEIAVQFGTSPGATPQSPWAWDAAAKLARATFSYPSGDAINELSIDSGDGSSVVFLIINSPLADRTWVTDGGIFVGATYVDEDMSIQVPATGGKVVVYSASGRSEVTEPAATVPALPAIGGWQWRDAAEEAAPGYDDASWVSSAAPQPFGANNFQNGYGWYRAKFTAAAGNVTATITGMRASAMAFANGAQVRVNNSAFSFNAVSGDNTVAILAKHEGLDKVYNVTGSTGTTLYAGIWGGVSNGSGALATAWKFRGGLGGMDETAVIGQVKNWSTFIAGAWADTPTRASWPAFWRGTFKSPMQPGTFVTVGLRTTGLSAGSVWLNGHNVGRFSGNTLLYLPESWISGDNDVVVYDASGSAPTGIKLEYFETRARYAYLAGDGGSAGTTGIAGAPGTGGANATGGNANRGGTTGAAGSVSRGGTAGRGGSTAATLAFGGRSNGGGDGNAGASDSESAMGGSVSLSGGGRGGSGGGAVVGVGGNVGRSSGSGATAGASRRITGANGGSTPQSAVSETSGSASGCDCVVSRGRAGGSAWGAAALAVLGLAAKRRTRVGRRISR
jgi:beta-galactosidase